MLGLSSYSEIKPPLIESDTIIEESMANFEKYAPLLSKIEGGFLQNGTLETSNRGVTIETYQRFYGKDRSVEDLKGMTEEQWRRIMKVGFWDKCRGDEIKNQSVAELLSDWVVNSGVTGIKRLQRALNLYADGVVGDHTIEVINSMDSHVLFVMIKAERKKFYDELIVKKPFLEKFRKGWYKRLEYFKFEES